MLLIAGCSSALNQTRRNRPAGNSEFPWATQVLQANGSGSPVDQRLTEPQRSMSARQAAKTAAIASLKQQVLALPVTPDDSLGGLAKISLGLKHAVETHLQTAQTVSEKRAGTDRYDVTVQLPLAPLVDILRRYHITSEGLPVMPEQDQGSVLPVS